MLLIRLCILLAVLTVAGVAALGGSKTASASGPKRVSVETVAWTNGFDALLRRHDSASLKLDNAIARRRRSSPTLLNSTEIQELNRIASQGLDDIEALGRSPRPVDDIRRTTWDAMTDDELASRRMLTAIHRHDLGAYRFFLKEWGRTSRRLWAKSDHSCAVFNRTYVDPSQRKA